MDPVSFKTWNTRYVAYARAHGRTPEEVLEHDRTERPGGVGFMAWIGARWRDFLAEKRALALDRRPYHDTFDAWLEERGRTTNEEE